MCLNICSVYLLNTCNVLIPFLNTLTILFYLCARHALGNGDFKKSKKKSFLEGLSGEYGARDL